MAVCQPSMWSLVRSKCGSGAAQVLRAVDVAAPGAVGVNTTPGPLGHHHGPEVGDQSTQAALVGLEASSSGFERRCPAQGGRDRSRTTVLGEDRSVGVADGADQQLEEARRKVWLVAANDQDQLSVGGLEAGSQAGERAGVGQSVADDAYRYGRILREWRRTGRVRSNHDDDRVGQGCEGEDRVVEEGSAAQLGTEFVALAKTRRAAAGEHDAVMVG